VGAVPINARNHLHDDTDEKLSSSLRDQALVRHYWRIAFSSSFSTKNWLKIITGKVNYWSALKEMLSYPVRRRFRHNKKHTTGMSDAGKNLHALRERGVRLFHIYSEGDEGLDYLYLMLGDELKDLISTEPSRFEIIEGANHTFTLLWSQEYLLELVCNWARKLM
jgi:hypothetical protein